ncbi:MAG: hypothetical protein CVV64_15010 [Candidatus Wallbacteria bacterium HGW-Wallbacteria-1]|jgi:hypothetical protein|uniref:Uncharacterized protein n=1 Tax=Candidatus Wallbacteria bacterium HGW-Wallbacteria-1 TaxID=2013854 RepID=A0A2N1PLT3_9BACT|nr:MAG: hypothetical protein CVV64_15010 [Candidatus Wallbacteria bacterium HGW-Wallbacteria-1]
MRYTTKLFILLFALVQILPALVPIIAPAPVHGAALDDRYERNGEAYLLIGKGDKRGVYKLNNHTSNVTGWLYDPREAYGLKVDLDRNIYTFSCIQDTDFQDVVGDIKVRICYPPQSLDLRSLSTAPYGGGLYNGFDSLGRKWLWFGSAHMTHHFVWGQTSYPDFAVPRVAAGTTAGRSGWYMIPNGSIYHSMDNMWSQDENGDGVPDLVPYITRQGWWNYANGYYWRNHGINVNPTYVYKETQKAKNYDFHLLQWFEGLGTNPRDLGSKAEAQELIINRRRVAGCTDGCFPGASELNQRAAGQIMKVLVSGLGRPYFYKRTEGQRNGQVSKDGSPYRGVFSGVNYNGAIIGDHNDLTTRFIGVSVKSRSEDFIYLLGDTVIRSWIPSTFGNVDLDIKDVAVSDQWWQSGGIVYVYSDKNGSGQIYMFVRDETKPLNQQDPPSRINVDSGIDDIAADGFGNLYYSKTALVPAGPAAFSDSDITNVTWEYNAPYAFARANVEYSQRVTKSVFMMDYYAGFATTRIGEVALGVNKWTRAAMYAPWTGERLPTANLSNVDRSKLTWSSPPVKVIDPATVNADEIPTELSVINVASPPQVVGFSPAKLDIDGVYDVNSRGELVAHNPQGFTFRAGPVYYFCVENAPVFDANGVNVLSRDLVNTSAGHVTAGGFTGGFCSTVIEPTMQFYWKITQLGVRMPDGSVSDVQIFPSAGDQAWLDTPIMGLSFSSKGNYRIDVSAKYDWYDYTRLQYGDLMDTRENTARVNGEWAKASDGSRTASYTFNINDDSQDTIAENAWVLMDSTDPATHSDTYAIDEDTAHSFTVIDKPGLPAANQVVSILSQVAPPDPVDPNYIADTKAWFTPLSVTWKVVLKSPAATENLQNGEVVFQPSIPQTSTFTANLNAADFQVPSDPCYYEMEVTVRRAYTYKIYAEMSLRPGAPPIRRPMPRFMEYEVRARSKILVRDTTVPTITCTQNRLFATTGDAFPDSTAFAAGLPLPGGLAGNPDDIIVTVTDNNPFSSLALSSPEFPAPGTTVSKGHFQANRLAKFSYQTSFSKAGAAPFTIPDAIANNTLRQTTYPGMKNPSDATDYYTCGDAGNAQSRFTFQTVAVTDPAKRKTTSSWQYTFPVNHRTFDDLIVDMPSSVDAAGAHFPIDYEGALSYSVALFDTSGNTAASGLGVIDVRDNDRPNLFVVVDDPRGSTSTRFVMPGNVKGAYGFDTTITDWKGGSFIQAVTGNDVATWNSSYTSLNFPDLAKQWPSSPCLMTPSPGQFFTVSEGTRVGFGCVIIDNVGGDLTESIFAASFDAAGAPTATRHIREWAFERQDEDGNWQSAGTAPGLSPERFPTRLNFRTPGHYRLVLDVVDAAKDWSHSTLLLTSAPAFENSRRLEFEFEVSDTTLNVHTIETR